MAASNKSNAILPRNLKKGDHLFLISCLLPGNTPGFNLNLATPRGPHREGQLASEILQCRCPSVMLIRV